MTLPYFSFLWQNPDQMEAWQAKKRLSDAFITDLGLGQLIESLSLDQKSKWAVQKNLYNPCASPDVIKYRLDIMDDLIKSDQLFQLLQAVILHLNQLQSVENEKQKKSDSVHQAAWFFQKIILYTDVITTLQAGLTNYKEDINSTGLKALLSLISQITNSSSFINMKQDITELKNQADVIRSISVCFNCQNETISSLVIDSARADYQKSLTAKLIAVSQPISFLVTEAEVDVSQGSDFSALEEQLLAQTIKAFPNYFSGLTELADKYHNYPLEHLSSYGDELRFYTAIIIMIKKLSSHGFKFCKPEALQKTEKRMDLNQVYDLSLALRLIQENHSVDAIVGNDHLSDEKGRVFILTGPNQGGKTTFLRSIGIAQILFQAGCFVPATQAMLSPVDFVFTHFQEKETLGVKQGRLGEEASRIAKIFQDATEYSLILLNETFSSARRVDGYHLSKDILKALMKYKCQAIFVTHITELTKDVALLNAQVSDGSKLVNLVAGIVDLDNTGKHGKRTYEIRRNEAPSGLGYSRDITLKYGLTYAQLIKLFEQRGLVEEGSSYEP